MTTHPRRTQSAEVLHALPSTFSNTSWLPVDVAADAILEVAALPFADAQTTPVWHILMDRSLPWEDALMSLSALGLKFDVVEGEEWLNRLRSSSDDLKVNPTKKLLSVALPLPRDAADTGLFLCARSFFERASTVDCHASRLTLPVSRRVQCLFVDKEQTRRL